MVGGAGGRGGLAADVAEASGVRLAKTISGEFAVGTATREVPAPFRISIVCADAVARRRLAMSFRRLGDEVEASGSADEALAVLGEWSCGVVVFDWDLPDARPGSFLHTIRSRMGGAVAIALRGAWSVAEHVRALDAGADDCVVCPADPLLVRARARTILRRCPSPPNEPVSRPNADRFELRYGEGLAVVCGRVVPLTRIEADILRCLDERRGEIVTREAMLREVWSHASVVRRETLDTHIWSLRRKLAVDDWLIETVRARGYRLRFLHTPGSAGKNS
jgi:DNA-binding response OmpR family regulator